MTEEEKKAIEMLKDRQKDLLEGSKSDFYSSNRELYKEHAEAIDTILNLIEKLKKENEDLKYENLNLKEERMIDNSSCKPLNNFYDYYDCIPKDKIKGKIKEYNKEIKTYEDKMLEITQREKHSAIENKDYIKYSCIISNFTDKIKLLEELLEEE